MGPAKAVSYTHLDEGDLQVDAHAPDGLERAQPLHYIGPGLLDNNDIFGQDQQDQGHKNQQDDDFQHRGCLLYTSRCV